MSKRLRSNQEGVALIEFAIALPVLVILLIGMAETAYYTLHQQKLDKLASAMADFVTQGKTVSVGDLNAFGLTVPQIMRPFNFSGTVIFSSASRINRTTGPAACRNRNPCIDWQYRILGSDSSRIGAPGTAPVLPGGYTLQSNQGVIVAEIFLRYTPLLAISSNFVPTYTAQTMYKAAVYKPRQQGQLTTLLP
ncbi:MAG: pilus assembly protein [Proteobacteria bacterium]|nr:pilus assembly protein [Pseudomonadota bacterium]